RLPYPNDPARPPQLVASRREAAALCEAEGKRLCTELEWERACKGDGAAPFPTGEALNLEACLADATACPSPLGVLDLGIRAPEWTASDAEPQLARLERTVVARGAAPDAPPGAHRCAARAAVAPEGRPLAFRCCGGAPNALPYPDVGLRRPFRDLSLETARVREILAGIPALARFADTFVPYDIEDARRALARGGATEGDMQWELAPGPFAWSPSPGEEVWVLAGRADRDALLAAVYPMPDGSFVHAASFVFEAEAAPLAILRTRASRHELLWTACWGCGGESGTIRFGEDARIVIAQQ
ncbi:MAG TPA: SUMF1/EgtB/PvdO family nonheme iron enzyme, partial [Sandaracinaceae bacterium]